MSSFEIRLWFDRMRIVVGLDKKKKEYSTGNTTGMSGRDMFMMDPNILARHTMDDDDEGEDFDLTREVNEDDVHVKVRFIYYFHCCLLLP